jgi:CDP-diacylglycerol--glycerol-3-phosphate 3-phosphatidyltransferase
MTLANKITLTRTLFGIILFFLIKHDNLTFLIIAFVVLVISTISDYIDGKIARKTNTTTKFGAIVDPFADKIIVFSCYLSFLDIKELNIPVFPIFLIIIRELSVASLRVLTALENYVLGAEPSGKLKTLLQFISIYLIMIYLILKNLSLKKPEIAGFILNFSSLPSTLIIITSIVTIISGIIYIVNHYSMISKQWGKN